jgi:hypothetical protein
MMGYTSHVMAVIYPDEGTCGTAVEMEVQQRYGQLKVLVATAFKGVTDEFGAYMTWLDDDYVLKFDLPSTKWYPSYGWVQEFMGMLRAFSTDVEGYCTEFVRLGEESDDTEECRTGEHVYYHLSVCRSISCAV